MAICISIIGKDNGPLYFEYSEKTKDLDSLEFHMIVSSALDIIEERVQSSGKIIPSGGLTESTRELYLGALTTHEDYKVYGYYSNTKIKFVIIMQESSVPLRENEIRTMFRKLHEAYCDLMSNPFYLPGSEITSKRFKQVVSSLMGSSTQ